MYIFWGGIDVPGGGYVELLQEVVDDEDGDHDGDEERIGIADDENGPFKNKRKIKPIFQKSYKTFFYLARPGAG